MLAHQLRLYKLLSSAEALPIEERAQITRGDPNCMAYAHGMQLTAQTESIHDRRAHAEERSHLTDGKQR